MGDEGIASPEEVGAELAKPGMRARLMRIAIWNTRNSIHAEDLLGRALLRTVNLEDWPWVRTERSFLTHMMQVMHKIAWRDRRRGPRREIPNDPVTRDESVPSPETPADELLDEHRSAAVCMALGEELRKAIDGDPIAERILELNRLGIDDEPEIAAAIPCSLPQVYAAMKKLKYHGARIRDAWVAREAERMRALREAGE
jgi:DNA-directed RNA polymerase specialized sigma24 family protein